jgi:hypothetical protein
MALRYLVSRVVTFSSAGGGDGVATAWRYYCPVRKVLLSRSGHPEEQEINVVFCWLSETNLLIFIVNNQCWKVGGSLKLLG